jgi:flagellin
MIQTADGALEVIDEKLIRMKELAEQAATGTYTSDQRIILNSEFSAMASEISRIAYSTNFNGINLLGSVSSLESNLQVKNWNIVNDHGFGDVNTWDIKSSVVADGALFYGTSNDADGCEVYKYDGKVWQKINEDGFGDIHNVWCVSMVQFNGQIFAGTTNTASGGAVYRYDGENWTQVSLNGFGSPNNGAVESLTVYNNRLYAGTANSVTGSEIWAYSGAGWERVVSDGLGNSNNIAIYGFGEVNGELFAGTRDWAGGGEVWKFNGSDWSLDVEKGFGDVNTSAVFNFQTYHNEIYASTMNAVSGGGVWKRTEAGWVQVNVSGFGKGNVNQAVQSLTVSNNRLYASTENGLQGGEVYAYDGKSWGQVNDSGFSDANNRRIPVLSSYEGSLYAAATNNAMGASVWRMENDESKIKIHFGPSNLAEEDYYYVNCKDASASVDGLDVEYLNIDTQNGAQYSLVEIDRAMIQKDKIRASLGATQNRLENTISNLQIQAENLQAAESQISDVDVADEMTNFVKEQILSQAATAMLAQANSIPKMAIQLISGG